MLNLLVGVVPGLEAAAQIGKPYYEKDAIAEINAYKNQLIRICGEPPAGAKFVVVPNPHDFGTYYELELQIEGDFTTDAMQDYIDSVEDCCEYWDYQALKELANYKLDYVIRIFNPDTLYNHNNMPMDISKFSIRQYGYNDADKTFARMIGNSIFEVYALAIDGWDSTPKLTKHVDYTNFHVLYRDFNHS